MRKPNIIYIYADDLGPALVTAEGWKLRYVHMNDS